MSQRVDYEAITGARFDQYPIKLRLIFGFLQTPGNAKFKPFRDFVRRQNMWDKERSPGLYSIVDISWDKTDVKVGKTAKKLMAARSDVDFQTVLFERLRELNILLVKYVLEALDVQQGGRLHSIHELYRMITSYVYPGKYITLVSFQAWVDWLAASGTIRLIGIRWGLSERGQKLVPELRMMDLDEILEDLEDAGAEDGQDDGEEEDDDLPMPAVDEGGRRSHAPAPSSARGGDFVFDGDDFEDEDLFDDLPPEPEAPTEAVIKAAKSRLGLVDDDDDDEPRPVARRGVPSSPVVHAPAQRAATRGAAVAVAVSAPVSLSMPIMAATSPVLPAAAFDLTSDDSLAILARITAWHEAFSSWPSVSSESLGVVYAQERGDLAILIEIGTFAILAEGATPVPQILAFAKKLKDADFFETLVRGDGADAAFASLDSLREEPWCRPLLERLSHARAVANRANSKIDLLYQLKQSASASESLALVREHLVGGLWREAPFFVIRELVRLGVLDSDTARSTVVVPTARLIRNAALIGLVRAENLYDFKSLEAISQTASALVGAPELGYGLALERLDLGLGEG